MTDLPRTVDEITARVRQLNDDPWQDFLGAQRTDLIAALPFADAKPWLNDDATEADWAPTLTTEQVRDGAVKYLEFAMGKADDHRGLSANRSIDHYRSAMWLLGLNDKVDWDNYPQYGAPILRQCAGLLDADAVWQQHSTAGLERMAQGLPCTPDGCDDGCGS